MLKNLTVKNFRVFKEISVAFSPGINIILGKNGVGKTSILEAVYFICFTKSFKAQQDVDMVRIGESHFQIRTEWEESRVKEAQGNFLKQKGKRFIFDRETMTRMADIIGIFPLVFQSPEDYRVTAGPGIERRMYFDRFISQISRPYLQDLMLYRRLVKSRNAHLKELGEKKQYRYTRQLEAYDVQLSPPMFRIVAMREGYAELFNRHLGELYAGAFSDGTQAHIAYKPSIAAKTEEEFSAAHLGQTRENIEKEIVLRRTLWGPNYDKYIFYRNSTPLIHYASQGEHKLWMTLLKLAEGEIISEIRQEEPVYLFDDLFAELDVNNSRRIIERVMHKKQVLITTTDLNDLRRHGMDAEGGKLNIIEIS